jgi:hypothetical protein
VRRTLHPPLKESLPWVRTFDTVEELRRAPLGFRETYNVYRPRLVRHRAVAYAAKAAVESWSCRTTLGGLNPWRSISQVEL